MLTLSSSSLNQISINQKQNNSSSEEEDQEVTEAKVAAATATRDLGTRRKRERDFFSHQNTLLFLDSSVLSFHFLTAHILIHHPSF